MGTTYRTCVLIVALAVCGVYSVWAQDVVLPSFDDEYSRTVARLEMGEADVDFQAFRFSFVESPQFKVASEKRKEFKELEERMYKLMKRSEYADIVVTTKKMLSVDYTSMIAHKILRQTYGAMGDSLNAAKYKHIQFGLLKSITENGDGRSCESAWPVIQIEEEYFILRMLGAELTSQQIVQEGGLCDRMKVTVDGEAREYFFETSKVFLGYKKLGLE